MKQNLDQVKDQIVLVPNNFHIKEEALVNRIKRSDTNKIQQGFQMEETLKTQF